MKRSNPTAREIGNSCICLNLRRAARVVARRYDEALRPAGITSGQFSIMASLLQDDAVAISALAETLGMDRTTLNRNIRPLENKGLVRSVGDPADRRVRRFELTARGQSTISHAMPLWVSVQKDTKNGLGDTSWLTLRKNLQQLV